MKGHPATISLLTLLMCLGSASAPSAASLWPGAFRLVDVRVSPEGRQYLADASEGSRRCQFNIRVKLQGRSLFGSEVTFSRVPDSDCRGFLDDLAQVLRYKGTIPSPRRRTELSAPMAFLGDRQLRMVDGSGFTSGPAGTWLVSKLFLAEGAGEVFFNLDETNQIGEFSLKDDDYATVVVTELASVFLPR